MRKRALWVLINPRLWAVRTMYILWVKFCSCVNEPRVYHTEWIKSEIEEPISYINSCMWDLENCYRWTYLLGRNRDADIGNRCVDTGWNESGEWGCFLCTSMCKIDPDPDPAMSKTVETYLIAQGAQVGTLWRPNWDWGRDRGRSKREVIYVYVKLIHFIVQQELTQHGKATLSQLIKKKNLLLTNFSMWWEESGLAYS